MSEELDIGKTVIKDMRNSLSKMMNLLLLSDYERDKLKEQLSQENETIERIKEAHVADDVGWLRFHRHVSKILEERNTVK